MDTTTELQKILTKLLANGYNARMSGNKMFVMIMGETPKPICQAYSSSWHDIGLIEVYAGWGVTETHYAAWNADEAYDMLIKIYKETQQNDLLT